MVRWNWQSLQSAICWGTVLLLAATADAGGPKLPWQSQTTLSRLASKIDRLEKHIEVYGTIVPKTPDVWGEARLTKFRVEFEEQMAGQKSAFGETINAAISRTDQAFLTTAMTLQAAISGSTAPQPAPVSDPFASTVQIQDTKLLREDDLQGFGDKKIALEPVIALDQRARYLNHLHQLRRNNDGDDRSDSPGYALHLVRVPVSVLPGRSTESGYGAEITITARPHIHDKLLESTFRELVVNDLVDQLSFPLVKFLDSEAGRKVLTDAKRVKSIAVLMDRINEAICQIRKLVSPDQPQADTRKLVDFLNHAIQNSIATSQAEIERYEDTDTEVKRNLNELTELGKQLDALTQRGFFARIVEINQNTPKVTVNKNLLDGFRLEVSQDASKVVRNAAAAISLSPSRRSRLPFPPSRLIEVLGANELLPLAEIYVRLADQNGKGTPLNILDVQKSLAEEIRAALAYVDQNPHLWTHCDENLARQVRDFNHQSIETLRAGVITPLDDVLEKSHTAVLVWAVLVESSLLNERLIDDMKQMQAAKNCACLTTEWLPYFLPNPEPHVVEAFRQYVECRWPIQVFAVDPITNDQNVAESVSIRREMQLALSVALANGQINVQHFLRYARALALDQETIALNRTAVGFSHGGDTFGWRFYPRVQAPPSRGNLAVATRELFIGGMSQDHLLRSRRLEPGMRECTAIVLMPGFVPYVTFDTRTNWFRLDNPARRQFDLKESIAVSEDITSMRELVQACVKDQHLYRPDEVRHLQLAVEQLERRLPLQTAWVQLPFENTLGGFEFFNGGSPDLSPELHGFYGEPGLRAGKEDTTSIFLVGDNFSVHETSVIVGNKAIDPADRQLLSRQVMRVTVKGPIEAAGKKIDIHIATPYGVSNHLDVPLIPAKPDAAAAEAAKKAVAEHVEQQHVDRLVWKSPPELSLVYEVRDKTIEFGRWTGDLRNTSIEQVSPFSPVPHNAATLQCLFRYTISVPGEAKPRKTSIILSNGSAFLLDITTRQPLSAGNTSESILSALETSIRGAIPEGVKAFQVKLETFARKDPNDTRPRRVEPDLTIAVEIQHLVPSGKQDSSGDTGAGVDEPPTPSPPADAARLRMELRERDQAALPLLAP